MNVLITGGAYGLGTSIVEKFNKNGYNVIITYNNHYEEALKIKDKIENSTIIKCDISNEEDINNLIDNIDDVDILINNAALSLDDDFENKTKNDFMKVLEVNVVGTFLLTRKIISNTNVKTVINISSTDSIDTYSEYNVDYSVSKAGVNLLTNIFADKYKNIKFCTVMPNWIATDSVLSMNKEYLSDELKRVNQNRLLSCNEVSDLIFDVATNDKYKSKDVVRIE